MTQTETAASGHLERDDGREANHWRRGGTLPVDQHA